MIVKRDNRIYGVGETYVIQRSSLDSEVQKVTITASGMDSQILYQGEKFVDVFEAIGAELGKNKTRPVVDVDAIIEALDPQVVETPVTEAPPTPVPNPAVPLQPA